MIHQISAKSKSKSKEGATSGWFSKFPKDVILSEKLTGGDEQILEKEPYADKPAEKVNYKELFGQNSTSQQEKEKKKVEASPKSAGKKRKAETSPAKKTPQAGGKKKKESEKPATPARPIVHPRFKEGGSGSDHQVRQKLKLNKNSKCIISFYHFSVSSSLIQTLVKQK